MANDDNDCDRQCSSVANRPREFCQLYHQQKFFMNSRYNPIARAFVPRGQRLGNELLCKSQLKTVERSVELCMFNTEALDNGSKRESQMVCYIFGHIFCI